MHICNGSATKSVGLLSKLSSVLVQPCSHCCWNYGRPRSDDQSYNDNLGQTNLWNYAVPESIAWLTHVEANVTSSLDGQVSQSEPHTVRTVVAMAVPKDTHATWLSWWQWMNWFDSMLLPAVAGTWHAAWGCKHFARVFNLWLCPELGDTPKWQCLCGQWWSTMGFVGTQFSNKHNKPFKQGNCESSRTQFSRSSIQGQVLANFLSNGRKFRRRPEAWGPPPAWSVAMGRDAFGLQ